MLCSQMQIKAPQTKRIESKHSTVTEIRKYVFIWKNHIPERCLLALF